MNNKSDSFEHSEIISAYLDGEVTEEERAFVEESPDLLKEVEKLKKIQKITSSPTPIDPVLQEKHLAKALSSLPKGGKVIPFRQQKIIQRGTLLAVAAAAAAGGKGSLQFYSADLPIFAVGCTVASFEISGQV